MLRDVRELLRAVAYRALDMEKLLDPDYPSFYRFDPELGYVPSDCVVNDGMDGSLTAYTYDPGGGHRKMINYATQPCRINTYGNSVTMCQQVSDGETWQEVLAAHMREPIRNFGVGGYGMYQAYRRALRVEATDQAAEYVILNIWDDDHVRNLDAARWIRSGWGQRDRIHSAGDAPWHIHGFPWVHLRFDPDKHNFVEVAGLCKNEDDLRELTDPDCFYEAFKDDTIVHLFTLSNGGEAPVKKLEVLAEALGVQVDLRHPEKRLDDARRLHLLYGVKSTCYLLDKLRAWAREQGRKLMVILSYGPEPVLEFVRKGERFDKEIVEYLEAGNVAYVDCLPKTADDYRAYNLSFEEYVGRLHIPASGAAVFTHYRPCGNLWFAFNIKDEIANWLDPKPPAYREGAKHKFGAAETKDS